MGKSRRLRRKLHLTSSKDAESKMDTSFAMNTAISTDLPLKPVGDNLFAGITIDIDCIKKIPKDPHNLKEKKLAEDLCSVKSFKSSKSEKGSNKIIPKKNKLKLRRDLFLKKLDTINYMKKEIKQKEKRRKVPIIGDTKSIIDSLPSLESCLKDQMKDYKLRNVEKPKVKGIEKFKKRKKKQLEDLYAFKRTLKNKSFSENSFEAITSHIKNVVNREKQLNKNKI